MSSGPLPHTLRVILGQNPGLRTGRGTNTYPLGSQRLILIDTGAGVPAYESLLRGTVERAGGRLSLILVTHGHQDHVGGTEAVRSIYPDAVARKFPGDESSVPFLPIEAGELIRLGGITLHAIHTPGHAADHLCFHWLEERALFSGDLVLGQGPVVIPRKGGSVTDYLASLDGLRSLDIRRIYPGHGPVIQDPPAKIAGDIEHRRMRERQIVEALEAGARTIQEMVARIYSDIPKGLHGLAEETVWNHLIKLEGENRIRRTEVGGKEFYEFFA